MNRRFTDKQTISFLRDPGIGATSIKSLCEKHNLTERTFFRWRNCFGGLDVPNSLRLKDLKSENNRLKRLVAEQMMVIDRMKKFVPKNTTAPSQPRDTIQYLVRRGISQRKALGYPGLSRRIASYVPRQAAKDPSVAGRLLAASPEVHRFGNRQLAPGLAVGEARSASNGGRWAGISRIVGRADGVPEATSGLRAWCIPTRSGAATSFTTR